MQKYTKYQKTTAYKHQSRCIKIHRDARKQWQCVEWEDLIIYPEKLIAKEMPFEVGLTEKRDKTSWSPCGRGLKRLSAPVLKDLLPMEESLHLEITSEPESEGSRSNIGSPVGSSCMGSNFVLISACLYIAFQSFVDIDFAVHPLHWYYRSDTGRLLMFATFEVATMDNVQTILQMLSAVYMGKHLYRQ